MSLLKELHKTLVLVGKQKYEKQMQPQRLWVPHFAEKNMFEPKLDGPAGPRIVPIASELYGCTGSSGLQEAAVWGRSSLGFGT